MAKRNPPSKLKAWERRLKNRYNTDFSTPENARKARIHIDWVDHGILRRFWTNEMEIAPGVWRSNNPTEARFRALPGRGIKTVLNLRGVFKRPVFEQEMMLCDELGLELINVPMAAREPPIRETILELIATFRRINRPFLMHCKSGADRTGLASAIYLIEIEGKPVAEARKMLSLRFIHLRRSTAGVLDRVLDAYEPFEGQKSFESWMRDDYEPSQVA